MSHSGLSVSLHGSSPRAWGILTSRNGINTIKRFIPTCVGNTSQMTPAALASTVHPHVRGEYPALAALQRGQRGSSPRAWGIQKYHCDLHGRPRFIPTCVGNTSSWAVRPRGVAVHPHVRGEYCMKKCAVLNKIGSSPRAWGIPQLVSACRRPERFIPTCVGNTVF